MTLRDFVRHHFRHFNAAVLRNAAQAWVDLLESGGKMMVTLAGAMSTAELGVSLAEMIRRNKVHAVTCTGANLEEDLFNLVAHSHYLPVPHYRELSAERERELLERHLNRVTDTCIPEDEAFRRVRKPLVERWRRAAAEGMRKPPHRYLYELLLDGELEDRYEINPRDSWLLEAARADLPLFVPGWEDSTLGNVFAASCIRGEVATPEVVASGIDYMIDLVGWYERTAARGPVGFFQIGGGIAGDFPICVVPLLNQDLERSVPVWAYFCQISDSTTSYGSYSGAVPNEKITWGKLLPSTPRYLIESDATIVAPLVFGYVLDS